VPFQVGVELGAMAFVPAKFSWVSVWSVPLLVRSRPGLPSWLKALAGMGVPVMSSLTANLIFGLPEIFLMASRGPTCRPEGRRNARH